MSKPVVYADFHNADVLGRLRLNCTGSLDDLARQNVQLQERLELALYTDDLDQRGQLDELRVDGVATYSEDEQCWVAAIDWNAIHHAADCIRRGGDGAGHGAQPLSGRQ